LPDGMFSKNLNLGKFWRALEWKRLVNSVAIWYILQPCGICIYGHLVIKWQLVYFHHFLAMWYIPIMAIW
jgi:hypothetical protein